MAFVSPQCWVQVTTFTYSVDENGAVGFQRRDFQRQQHGVVTRPQATPAPAAAAPPAPEHPQTSSAAPADPPPAHEAPAQPPAATGGAAAVDGAQALEELHITTPEPGEQVPEPADPAAAQAPAEPLDTEEAHTDDESSAPAGLPDEASVGNMSPLPE